MSILFSLLAAALADSVMILGQMVPASAIQPVAKDGGITSYSIDTIQTSVPGVSILLYNDNTWRYSKSDQYIADCKVFTCDWDETSVNPYKEPVDSLPETWAIWMVDSLGGYHCPALGRVSSKFGIRHGRRHQGVDMALPIGTPLYATFDGKVRVAKWMKGYGNIVILRHDNGLETFYGHMSQFNVKPGDIVHAGDVIGLSGNTGRSTGPHIHYEVRYHGLALDPQRIVNLETGDLKQRIMVLKRRYFDAASRYDQNFDDEFLNEEDDKKALEEKKKKDAEAARKAMVYHKVRSGENLGMIARKYHTTVNAICRLNGLKNANSIRAGKTLRVR